MKNCSERGLILAELSNNTLPYSENEPECTHKGSDPESVMTHEGTCCVTVNEIQSPCNVAGDQEHDDVSSSRGVLPDGNTESLAYEDSSPQSNRSQDTLSSHTNSSMASDLNSGYSLNGSTGESEGLVENGDDNQRKPSLKSILKIKFSTPSQLSPTHEANGTPNQQTSLNDIETSSKVSDPQESPGRGLVVFIPGSPNRKSSRKRTIQLAAMSICGFILVSIILAWLFSPTFL